MVIDIMKFLVIFGITMFIFSCMGLILFKGLDDYATINLTIMTLFKSCMGAFDFDPFDDLTDTSPYVGYIFMTVFIIFMMITLLNFIIAILSDTYAVLKLRSQSLYLREVVLLKHKLSNAPTISCIVAAWVLWNLIVIPFLPFLVLCRNSVCLNSFVLHIIYLPVAIVGITAYVAIIFILWPIAYIAGGSVSFSKT